MILAMQKISDAALTVIQRESIDSAERCPVFYDALHQAAHLETVRRLNAKAEKRGFRPLPFSGDVTLPLLSGNELASAALEALVCRDSFDLMASSGMGCEAAAEFFQGVLYTLCQWQKSTTQAQ